MAIKMNEIPFSTGDCATLAPSPRLRAYDAACEAVAPGAPQLSDTVPPIVPPAVAAPYKRPVAHKLVAWRHNPAGLDCWQHETLESAQAADIALHYVTYWKSAIMAGRDMVSRRLIGEPTQD